MTFPPVRLWATLVCAAGLAHGQQARVSTDYTQIAMPSDVDSNSPGFWRDGELHLFNSTGVPMVTKGADQLLMYLGQPHEVVVDTHDRFPMWIEAAWQDEDGTIYAWYHHEPGGVCPDSSLSVPQIGALVSTDGGATFNDLGIVLSAADAYSFAVSIEPKIIIPMHYGSVGQKNALNLFLKEGGGSDDKPTDKLVIKKKDLEGKEGDIVVLNPQN